MVVSLLASIACFSTTAVFAQREDDNFSHSVRYDGHAACNSKILPKQGFTIVGVVPGSRGKECYWKRSRVTTLVIMGDYTLLGTMAEIPL